MIKSVIKTPLEGVLIIQNEVYSDNRGSFIQNYQFADFYQNEINYNFVQDNVSSSRIDVIRGLHYQLENPQAKLVSVLKGSIYDVAVDIRIDSPTYGEWFGTTLSELDGRMLLIPEGFAHGFKTMSDRENIVIYKSSENYNKDDEYSINWNDPTINITWPRKFGCYNLSEKDAKAPYLKDIHIGSLPKYDDGSGL